MQGLKASTLATPMCALGQKQTFACTSRCPLSVNSGHRHLFYHLVSKQLHRVGDREPERLRSSEIDDQLELGWLLDRHVAGLLAP